LSIKQIYASGERKLHNLTLSPRGKRRSLGKAQTVMYSSFSKGAALRINIVQVRSYPSGRLTRFKNLSWRNTDARLAVGCSGCTHICNE
jgi:hypothetical protein